MSDGWFFVVFFLVIAVFALTAGRGNGIFTEYLTSTSTTAVLGNSEAVPRSGGSTLKPVPLEGPGPDSYVREEFEITSQNSHEAWHGELIEEELSTLLNDLQGSSY